MCKMAHFGNCDPETADQEYCIFHKPNKNEEEAREFYNKFVLRFFGYNLPWNTGWVFAGPVNANGFVFPELPRTTDPQRKTGEEFSFERVVFVSHVGFYKAVFEGSVPFRNAHFEDDVMFSRAQFKKRVEFNGAEFRGMGRSQEKLLQQIPTDDLIYGDVERIIHKEEARDPEHIDVSTTFIGTFFEDVVSFFSVTFKGSVLFDRAKFHRGAIFDEAKFEGFLTSFKEIKVEFSPPKVTFELGITDSPWYDALHQDSNTGISFIDSHFSSSIVEFNGATLNSGANFENAKFDGKEVNFHRTFFDGIIRFNNVTFNESADIRFQDCIFNSQAEFYRAKFLGRQTSFAHSTFKVAAFDFAEFGTAIFNFAVFENGASFKKVTFHGEAWFQEVEFKDKAAFDSAQFRKVSFNSAVFEKGASFNSATFKDSIEFEEVTILKPVEFRSVIFESHAKFLRDKFRGTVTFLDSIFKKDAIFDWSLFEGIVELTAEYYGKLSFKRSTFYLGVQIDWDRVIVKDIDAKKELVRIYVDALKKEGRIKEAYRFALKFKKELNRYRRKKGTIKDKLTGYIEWIALELPSEYLTNWKRTVISSIVTILVFGIIYYWISTVGGGGISDSCCEFSGANVSISNNISIKWASSFNVIFNKSFTVQNLSNNTIAMATGDNSSLHGCILKETPHVITDILNYIYFSAVTFTTLGYGDFHPVGIVKILASIEALLGVIYAAMISAILGKELFVEEFEE